MLGVDATSAVGVRGHDAARRHLASRSTAARWSASPASRATARAELVEAILGLLHPAAGSVTLDGDGHHRLVDPAAPRGRHRLHPRGPAPARPAARAPRCGRTACSATRRGRPTVRRAGSTAPVARDDTERIVERVRRPHPGDRDPRRRAVRRQPAEAHRRPRDERRPELLVAAHPTRGVDVGAQAAIWDHIRDARARAWPCC